MNSRRRRRMPIWPLPRKPVDQAGDCGSTGDRRPGGPTVARKWPVSGPRGVPPARSPRTLANSGSFNRGGFIVEHRLGSSDSHAEPVRPARIIPGRVFIWAGADRGLPVQGAYAALGKPAGALFRAAGAAVGTATGVHDLCQIYQ
jgi:hypothetical protein